MDFIRQNIKHLRKPEDSDTSLGALAGVHQTTVGRYLNGDIDKLDVKAAQSWANHFGVSLDDLVNRNLAADRPTAQSQLGRLSDAIMAQGVELLYLMADARPEDKRFKRPSWAMIQIAGKAIKKAKGDPRIAMAEILAELSKDVDNDT